MVGMVPGSDPDVGRSPRRHTEAIFTAGLIGPDRLEPDSINGFTILLLLHYDVIGKLL